jgi:hypothetical protein
MSGAVIAKTTRVDGRRDEVVPERVHGYQRRQLLRVAEVVGVRAARQGRAGVRFAREHLDLPPADVLADEREGEAGEVRTAADAPDDCVRKRTRDFHLGERLLADHGLVHEHMVEDAPERIRGVVAAGRVLDRL